MANLNIRPALDCSLSREVDEYFAKSRPEKMKKILVRKTTRTYHCADCGKMIERVSNKKWIPSFCEKTGKNVRLQLKNRKLKIDKDGLAFL